MQALKHSVQVHLECQCAYMVRFSPSLGWEADYWCSKTCQGKECRWKHVCELGLHPGPWPVGCVCPEVMQRLKLKQTLAT